MDFIVFQLCGIDKRAKKSGGYEEDAAPVFATFFNEKGYEYLELLESINKEKICIDCDDEENISLEKIVERINQILKLHGLELLVLEDGMYCSCEYFDECHEGKNPISLLQGFY